MKVRDKLGVKEENDGEREKDIRLKRIIRG